jgi:hypothetical protein
MSNSNITPAHQETVDVRFIERWPDHEPRKDDPNYKYFIQAKKRMKKLGLYKCNVDSNYHWGQLEAHHTKIEFAHINDVDIAKFNALWGLNLTDSEFQVFVEQQGNLEILCELHHRGQEGIHSLPSPEWNALRVAKNNTDIITVLTNSEIPVQKTKTGQQVYNETIKENKEN